MAEGSKKPAPANAELSQSRAEEAARHQRNLWHNREEYMLRMLDGATEQVYRQEGAPSNQPQLDCVDLRRRRRETMKLCRGYCEQLGIRPREMTEKQKRHEDRCVCPDNQKYVRMRRQHFGRQNLLAWQQERLPGGQDLGVRHAIQARQGQAAHAEAARAGQAASVPRPGGDQERRPGHERLAAAQARRGRRAAVGPDTRVRCHAKTNDLDRVLTCLRVCRQIEEIIKVDEEHRKEMKLLRWARKYRAKKRKKELAKMKRELAKAGKQPCRDRGDLEFELGEVLERLEREAGLNADDEDEDDDDGDRYSESDDDDFDFDEDDNDRVAPLSVIPVSS
uniref:Uncharacterized protein n=1 Tax=Trichogramma kaykai TaxID=54128 RepID=A0ABD2WTX6_9HYME